MPLIPMFTPDVPGAIVVPAEETNVLRAVNNPKVLVLHTPEEPSDDIEVTPYYFQRPNLGASTHFYSDSDGDLYQMVSVNRGAIANGVRGKPYPAGTDPAISLNYQSESIEIEGYAATISQTMPRGGPQWKAVVHWIQHRCRASGIPIDRRHIIGHYEVANNRSDPGTLDIDQLVRDAQEEGDDMTPEEKQMLLDARQDAIEGRNRSAENEKRIAKLQRTVLDQAVKLAEHEDAAAVWQERAQHVVAYEHDRISDLQLTVLDQAVKLAEHEDTEEGGEAQ